MLSRLILLIVAASIIVVQCRPLFPSPPTRTPSKEAANSSAQPHPTDTRSILLGWMPILKSKVEERENQGIPFDKYALDSFIFAAPSADLLEYESQVYELCKVKITHKGLNTARRRHELIFTPNPQYTNDVKSLLRTMGLLVGENHLKYKFGNMIVFTKSDGKFLSQARKQRLLTLQEKKTLEFSDCTSEVTAEVAKWEELQIPYWPEGERVSA
ncbi:hypothetical protein DFH05DRAFT_462440 [Lentinula detonsa]|uniref:Uncharacterized protein n=1 Tax=Lentinula detonsa TaxID=2804962 RepID=A0A9W8TUB0_9AGAR|nr:hypothetical protein DFH05DRAFT_462440 [Lentinula detonsa]